MLAFLGSTASARMSAVSSMPYTHHATRHGALRAHGGAHVTISGQKAFSTGMALAMAHALKASPVQSGT